MIIIFYAFFNIVNDTGTGYWVVLVLYSLLKGVTTLPTGVGAERAP